MTKFATRVGRHVIFEGGSSAKLTWREMFAIKVLRVKIAKKPELHGASIGDKQKRKI